MDGVVVVSWISLLICWLVNEWVELYLLVEIFDFKSVLMLGIVIFFDWVRGIWVYYVGLVVCLELLKLIYFLLNLRG